MRTVLIVFIVIIGNAIHAQDSITIDGNFTDWAGLPVLVTDPAHDEHDTDWFSDGLPQPLPRKYSDVDILEVKFTHDRENLYAYVKAAGIVGRTSRAADGRKAGRYYFIITIDVDDNDTTGYALQEGNYWPNSIGYDMNMEVEFYNGVFNTGHYINHDFITPADTIRGTQDLMNRTIRLGPGTYDNYLSWVVFQDSSFVKVYDRGPVYQGIIQSAVSADGHEAEMKAPMWGFFRDAQGVPIVKLGNTIDVSFSLEGSGELSESAVEAGYTGNKSVWGSDTADPIVGYQLIDRWTFVSAEKEAVPENLRLEQNFPNPFNSETILRYSIASPARVQVTIVNLHGQIVRRLYDGCQESGAHQIKWDGTDASGHNVPSGVYWAVLKTERTQTVRKMLLLR